MSQQTSGHLQLLKDRLQAIHEGELPYGDRNPLAATWLVPDVVSFLLEHGRQMTPSRVVMNGGLWMRCEETALQLATFYPDELVPYFGFRLFDEGGLVWFALSWCMEVGAEEQTIIDPSWITDAPMLYFGVPWCRELYERIPRRQGAASKTVTELPPVLARSLFDLLPRCA